ncbi:MAG: SDR family NAD(P)-dependent oxidoreductase [Bacteroidia bacterium]|nr:SDR family NAD(P)-dependent oxidoreductase [Bacteroidia bacterium]
MGNEIIGKVVLITGASCGIGAAASLAFNKAGALVAMAARRQERLEILASGMDHPLILQIDVSDEAQARQMVRDTTNHFGRIDVLVNNAASMIVTPAESVTSEDLLSAFHTNLLGPVAATVHMYAPKPLSAPGQGQFRLNGQAAKLL